MIILCTHNDGGVGKTTLAVHSAGVLISQLDRTLLIDCDDQADSWQFYTGREPSKLNDIDIEDNRTVISNKNRASIKKLAKPQQYDHVVLDIDSPLQNTVQVIIGNDPDLIPLLSLWGNSTHLRCYSPRKIKVSPQFDRRGITPNQPLVRAKFPGSQVSPNSPFYIERPPIESRCCNEILQLGALIRIKAPKQMGKILLLNYILNYAKNQSCRTVPLSFQQADEEAVSNLSNLLRWFCKSISWKLKLEPKLDNYWDTDAGLAKYNCTRYFEEYLLEQINCPFVLGLDELERLFAYPKVAQDFLPLLRVWHEQANESKIWVHLRLVAVHSTELYVPLDINQSPFNVGLPMGLPEWNSEQIQALARCYSLNWGNSEAEQLMAIVGGYPYLVQLALYHLQNQDVSLEQLLQDAPIETGIYINHLRYLENIQAVPKLSTAIREVVNNNESVLLNSVLAYQLQSIGLVKFDGSRVMPSCQLYRKYFRARLLKP